MVHEQESHHAPKPAAKNRNNKKRSWHNERLADERPG
jgi:hypothetical protein